jgi:hypothetical protein
METTENTKRTYRMYGFVPFNLSPIQKGIQFGHAVQEYNNMILNLREVDSELLEPFDRWRKIDKTFIVLDGGTTNNRRSEGKYIGTLNQIAEDLTIAEIPRSLFYEPDLGDCLTSVVFLADDRVFDKVKWPDYSGSYYTDIEPEKTPFWKWKMKFSKNEIEADKIVFLRELLSGRKLA